MESGAPCFKYYPAQLCTTYTEYEISQPFHVNVTYDCQYDSITRKSGTVHSLPPGVNYRSKYVPEFHLNLTINLNTSYQLSSLIQDRFENNAS